MRYSVRNKRYDRRAFTHTADRSRAINLGVFLPRGGIRL